MLREVLGILLSHEFNETHFQHDGPSRGASVANLQQGHIVAFLNLFIFILKSADCSDVSDGILITHFQLAGRGQKDSIIQLTVCQLS